MISLLRLPGNGALLLIRPFAEFLDPSLFGSVLHWTELRWIGMPEYDEDLEDWTNSGSGNQGTDGGGSSSSPSYPWGSPSDQNSDNDSASGSPSATRSAPAENNLHT